MAKRNAECPALKDCEAMIEKSTTAGAEENPHVVWRHINNKKSGWFGKESDETSVSDEFLAEEEVLDEEKELLRWWTSKPVATAKTKKASKTSDAAFEKMQVSEPVPWFPVDDFEWGDAPSVTEETKEQQEEPLVRFLHSRLDEPFKPTIVCPA